MEGDEGESGRQRSRISLSSPQSLVCTSCVFTPLPEGIKVNMMAYPQLPHTGLSSCCIHLFPAHPLSHQPLSCHPAPSPVHFGGLLVWLLTRKPKSAESLCISYLLCLTKRDKPVFITLSDLFCKSEQHTHTPVHFVF